MRSLAASTTYTIPFSTSVAPDELPTATAYADETSLGAMTVTAEDGTNEYSVAVVLPGNVTQGQIITVKIDWLVGGESQSTVTLLVGQVGLTAEIASAVANEATIKALIDAWAEEGRLDEILDAIQATVEAHETTPQYGAT